MPEFKIITWNVENLFRPATTATPIEKERYQLKLSLIANVLNNHAQDVVALQEVGGEEPLHDLQLALGDTYPNRAISVFPDIRGIRVTFLSKLPIEEQVNVVDFPPGPALAISDLTGSGATTPITRMSRGSLRIRVTKEGLTVNVITTHLKSKLLSFPRPGGSSFSPRDEGERAQVAGIALHKRTAKAVTLRTHINGLLMGNTQAPLLLLGDFNDVPEAQTSLLLTGPPGSEIGTLGFKRPDKGDDARIFNLAPVIPEERRYSRINDGRKELIDHIYASEEFFPLDQSNHRQLPVVDSIVDFSGELPSVGEDPNTRAQDVSPDHAPVMASFNL